MEFEMSQPEPKTEEELKREEEERKKREEEAKKSNRGANTKSSRSNTIRPSDRASMSATTPARPTRPEREDAKSKAPTPQTRPERRQMGNVSLNSGTLSTDVGELTPQTTSSTSEGPKVGTAPIRATDATKKK